MKNKEKKSTGGKSVIAAGLLAVLALLGGGIGFGAGNGTGFGNSDEGSRIEENQDDYNEDNGFSEEIILAVTVSGNDYFYENEKILLEDLLEKVKEIESEVLVEVKDEDASFNAYQNLLDKLDELNVNYREK